MYIVEGLYPNGERCKPLKYATLDEAMKKLRDLAEADELDAVTGGDGPMFVAYTLRIEPLPGSSNNDAGTEARPTGEGSTGDRPTGDRPTDAQAARAAWQPRLSRD